MLKVELPNKSLLLRSLRAPKSTLQSLHITTPHRLAVTFLQNYDFWFIITIITVQEKKKDSPVKKKNSSSVSDILINLPIPDKTLLLSYCLSFLSRTFLPGNSKTYPTPCNECDCAWMLFRNTALTVSDLSDRAFYFSDISNQAFRGSYCHTGVRV